MEINEHCSRILWLLGKKIIYKKYVFFISQLFENVYAFIYGKLGRGTLKGARDPAQYLGNIPYGMFRWSNLSFLHAKATYTPVHWITSMTQSIHFTLFWDLEERGHWTTLHRDQGLFLVQWSEITPGSAQVVGCLGVRSEPRSLDVRQTEALTSVLFLWPQTNHLKTVFLPWTTGKKIVSSFSFFHKQEAVKDKYHLLLPHTAQPKL